MFKNKLYINVEKQIHNTSLRIFVHWMKADTSYEYKKFVLDDKTKTIIVYDVTPLICHRIDGCIIAQ